MGARRRAADGTLAGGPSIDMAKADDSILFISMYPLDALDRAPKVRSYHLWQELNRLVPCALVEGRNVTRSLRLLRMAVTGRLFRFKAAYVESSSASATPLDLLALALLRFLRRPTFIFVRDAYPMFPAEFPARRIRLKLRYWGWRFSFQMYKRLATRLLFPTTALAELFDLEDGRCSILPPGGQPLVKEAATEGTCRVGYVGDLNPGVVRLLRESMRRVQTSHPDVRCTVVSSISDWKDCGELASESWCEHRQASRRQLPEVLEDVDFCLIPRPSGGYNSLTLPVKLFDYMSLGKATVTTYLPAVADIVRAERVGIVTDDNADAFGRAIVHLLEHSDEVHQYQLNALEAIRTRHSWRNRADRLLEIMKASSIDLLPNAEQEPNSR